MVSEPKIPRFKNSWDKKVFTSFKAEVNELDNKTKFILVYLPHYNEIVYKIPYQRKEIINF